MGRKRKPKTAAEAPADDSLPDTPAPPAEPVNVEPFPEPPPYDADPDEAVSNDPPPAPGAGSWVIIAIHKTKFGDSHRVLSRDWKLLIPDTRDDPRDHMTHAMRFESKEDADKFISGELNEYGDERPLCLYRFTSLDMSD